MSRLSRFAPNQRPLTDPNTLGGRLHIARSHRKVAIHELAFATGVGTATIFGLECGLLKTTPHCIRRLAAALEIDAEWLEHGKAVAA